MGWLPIYDDYGNMLYGAIGNAFGLPYKSLMRGAQFNQILKGWAGDDWRDQIMINRGVYINKYYQSQIITISDRTKN